MITQRRFLTDCRGYTPRGNNTRIIIRGTSRRQINPGVVSDDKETRRRANLHDRAENEAN